MAERKMVSAKPTFVPWDEEGTKVAGSIKDMSFVDFKEGAVPRYTVEDDDGQLWSFLAPVQIADALRRVPEGVYVEITQMATPRGKNYKEFDVQVEEHEPLPMRPAPGVVNRKTGEIGEESDATK